MTELRTVAIGWPKGMWSFAQTYVIEISGETVWLGHLGKGVVAHWADAGSSANTAMTLTHDHDRARLAGARAGAAAGKNVLKKMESKLVARYLEFEQHGHAALADSKKTRSLSARSFTGLELIGADGLTGNTPPALKALAPPYLRCQVDGEQHTFFAPRDVGVDMPRLAAALRSAGAA